MDFFESLCAFDERFYEACGHVVTEVKHTNNCRQENHDPYGHGQLLGHMCDCYHFKQALSVHSLCPFCSDPDYNAANVWRSDRNDEPLLRLDIQPRLVYWMEYIAEQRRLYARQESLESNARTALTDVENFVEQSPDGFPDGPEYERIGLVFLRCEKMRVWYLAQQNHHLWEIRRGIPLSERRYLFDEADVNPDILAPVLFADIPPDEYCGICRLPLSDREAWGSNGLRRVFCGIHIYHHDCIVPWFRTGGGQQVTCPTCRARRSLPRPPVQEWQIPPEQVEGDFLIY